MLLDMETRRAPAADDTTRGRLREPMQCFVPWVRAIDADTPFTGALRATRFLGRLPAMPARWMGVSDSNLALVAPNFGNYSARDLGLFRA